MGISREASPPSEELSGWVYLMRTDQWSRGSRVGLRPRIGPVKKRIRPGRSEIVKTSIFRIFRKKCELVCHRLSRKKLDSARTPHPRRRRRHFALKSIKKRAKRLIWATIAREMVGRGPLFLDGANEIAAYPSTRHKTLFPILIEAGNTTFLKPFTHTTGERESGNLPN